MSPSPQVSNGTLVRRLLGLARRHAWACAGLVILQIALMGLGVAGLWLTGLAIDTLQAAVSRSRLPQWPLGAGPSNAWTGLDTVMGLAAGVLLVGLCRGWLNYLAAVAAARLLQQRIVVDLRAAVYAKMQRLSLGFYSRNGSGSLINRITGDVQSVRLFIDGVLLQLVLLVVSLTFYLAYMLNIHAGLTLVCLATTPLLWWMSASFSRKVRPAYERNRGLYDAMLLRLTENVHGAHVVKGFGRQQQELEKFRRANQAVRDQQQWIFWRISLFTPTIEMLMSLNLVLLLGYGGYLVIEGRLALGSGLIVFCGLLQQFSGQVSKITNLINSVQQSLAGARRVFEVLDAPLEIDSPPGAPRRAAARGAVEFDHVGFQYAGGPPVLCDIHLRVEPGQCVALLGATGEGKTTLLNLIPRFSDATQGAVRVDGVDVRQWNLDDLRRSVGIVFQENFLFSDTVAANIAFCRPNASPADIERAARMARAHEFIQALPDGYHTVLREGGRDLSGGQRQRLAIARAVLPGPAILLLDDPTAAIDPTTEHEIWEAMQRAMAGRTTFVVAHRLSTLRRADLVIVLEDGRITEMGTHDQLMAGHGAYWKAAQIQEGDGLPITPIQPSRFAIVHGPGINVGT